MKPIVFHNSIFVEESMILTLEQLVPFIDNFNIHQLEYFLVLANETIEIDQKLTDKLYEQNKHLLYSEQSDFIKCLQVLALLTENPLEEPQLENFIKMIFTILEIPDLEASILAYSIYVYGLIIKQYKIESKEFYQSITRHLKNIDLDYQEIMEKGKKDSQLINFTQQDLKLLSLGLHFGGCQNSVLGKYISLKAQSIFVEISNLIFISKFLFKQEQVEQEFLTYFKQQLEKSKNKIQPDDLMQLAIAVKQMKQPDQQILEFIVKEFLRTKSNFTVGDKAFLYQKMAQMLCTSKELWTQFASEVKEITDKCEWFDACFMFYGIFDVFEALSPECQEFIFNYIIGHEKVIDSEMKKLLFTKLKEKGILTEQDIEESKKQN
ncbi:unnamed protein product (macronuclear) [Paramecium tetraurelia]|uniref:Uncharacterized protein n=1 Tax=Paramecium tetraurelia TaxID=5888 RepID=A0BGQ7_PARTE|nr:uncharacterized protein GSPATT00028759001 [Paramecium tetraurelia]CAK57724.1 unnamed protein product [Paramecium tetraurelia]|eukprot:XP_001425122.1 hypothetical protein (macronuclear) [Paramecium tetraurelia strain d4-2]